MNIEFYIHGVPKGFDYIGPEAERAYFSTFYSANKGERTKFTIEHRKIDGQPYCYYNYLKYHNIADADQRKGAYFGMSLRMDSYYADVIGLQGLFDLLFCKFVVGNILTENGDSMKYLVSQFSQRKDVIEQIQGCMIQMLQSLLSAKQLYPLSSTVETSVSSAEVSIFDYDKTSFAQMLQTHSKVSLSADTPSKHEKELVQQFNVQISQLRASKDKELNRLRQMLDEQEKELAELHETQPIASHPAQVPTTQKANLLTNTIQYLKSLLGK